MTVASVVSMLGECPGKQFKAINNNRSHLKLAKQKHTNIERNETMYSQPAIDRKWLSAVCKANYRWHRKRARYNLRYFKSKFQVFLL